MISSVGKGLSCFPNAAVSTVVPGLKRVRPAPAVAAWKQHVEAAPHSHSRAVRPPLSWLGGASVSNGIAARTQVRFAHTDVAVVRAEQWDHYRRHATHDPEFSSQPAHDTAVGLHSLILAATVGVPFAYAGKQGAHGLIEFLSPDRGTLAMSKVEVTLDQIPEGKNVTIKWRGKPLFIRHRTQEEIDREQAVDIASLRHPQTDQQRVQDPKWLIVVGVCTHLGCVPIAGAGEYGGYFCPCHGSHYDASGRIRKGPAPENLEVPEYQFVGDSSVVVG